MRVLLLHPEDNADTGPWAQAHWDRICDMGMAARSQYERWTRVLRCPIERLPVLQTSDFAEMRDAVGFGAGRLVDDLGLDWWKLLSFEFLQHIEQVIALRRFAETCSPSDEIFLSRAAMQARIAEALLSRRIRCLLPAPTPLARAKRAWRKLQRLRLEQVVEILGDKYDTGYQLRRLFVPRKSAVQHPVVLLPSAYGNAAATAAAYARTVPDMRFLLVTTRKSGHLPSLPQNVITAQLAGYARADSIEEELQRLLRQWQSLRGCLRENGELAILENLGLFDLIPAMLRNGLSIRNLWLAVFETEPVSAVLCADEANLYTGMPLLLARMRGLPSLACHHGALDVRYTYRATNADRVLAKGRMEADYLVRVCGVSESQVEIAGPLRADSGRHIPSRDKSSIVFFSEPYEAWGCRGGGVYEEVLPRLAEVARGCDRELVIKLHPFESRRERERLALRALSAHKAIPFRILDGPLTADLLRQIWCALTVTSSAAVDCALWGIPVFLCNWVDSSSHHYAEQFMKFGAAIGLHGPEQISEMSDRVRRHVSQNADALWHGVDPERLKALLAGEYKAGEGLVDFETQERAWA